MDTETKSGRTPVMIRRETRYVGLDAMIADVDRLVARGDLKPIWKRAVRTPEFKALLVRFAQQDPRP